MTTTSTTIATATTTSTTIATSDPPTSGGLVADVLNSAGKYSGMSVAAP